MPVIVPADLRLPHLFAPPLRGVLPDVARALGAPLPHAPTAGLDVPAVTRAVVVLVDGLGQEMLEARLGHAPTLRRLLATHAAAPLSAGFPSTTATSLAAFGTGLEAGCTGMVGYTARDPRTLARSAGQPRLLTLVKWDAGDGVEPPRPRAWQPHATFFEQLAAMPEPVRCTAIGRARFAGSGLSMAALRGPEFVGVESLSDAVGAARRALREPGLVYLYWGALDATAHKVGWASQAWADQLGELDSALARLLRAVPPGTAVVVTADHGMVDVTEHLDIAAEPALREGVPLVGGEPRAVHLYLRESPEETVSGEEVAAVVRRWREHLAERAWVLTREEAVSLGLFGVVEQRVRPLLGDVVVAARGTTALHDSRTQPPSSLVLVGMHGSLTTAELAIPGIVTLA